ncbi:MAG: RNA polymerase sigma factor [Pirellulaceae bacterium]|nr:RNA polymerase sigma factor [Planctomycetales bacterium]
MADDIQQPSDGTLIAEVLTGRRERFAVLVDRYQAPLIRVARSRLGRHDWAEDVVQETFLCAFKSLASYNSQYSFRTWLWTILLNQCRRHVQKRSRRPLVRSWSDQPASATDEAGESTVGDVLASSEESPLTPLLREERAERLERMLRQLPDKQADALRLRFFGGLQFNEIAAAMQCSLATAKNRVRWGLATLAQQTDRREAEALTGEQPSSPRGD